MKTRPLAILLLATGIAFLLGGCATEPNLYTGDTGYYGYTWEQELKLGAKADPGIVQEMGLYQDDAISDYVKNIGETLLVQSAMRADTAPEMYRNTEFTFRVLDSPIVNAFALPGGYVYVTRGLLAHVDNEAQLAVVIGHEITHVEARHASKQALKQQWGQIGLMAGAIIGEQVAENKEFARQALNLSGDLFQLVTLKYGREAERESDLHGVEYAAKAGYDSSQGSAFFRSLKRISEKSGQQIPTWMSSHPDPGEREATILQLAKQWNPEQGSPRVLRDEYLRKIEGLVVGENPRNGYIDSNNFYHPDLKIQFSKPSDWNIRNESSAVYLTSPNNSAIVAFKIATQSTAIEAAQAVQKSVGLQTSSARGVRINNLPAYTIEGVVPSDSGAIPLQATFIEFGNNVFTFLGYGSQNGYATYRKAIEGISSSFDELRNQFALNIQPTRLTIVKAPRNTAFRELLPDRLPAGMDETDWAIINQVELDEHIEKGALLKLPSQN